MAPMLSSPPPRYSGSSSSTASVHHSLADLLLLNTSAASGPVSSGEDGAKTDETLRHAGIRLDARHYQHRLFASTLLTILQKLRIAIWCKAQLSPKDLQIHRVSGALTNAVFFISSKSLPSAQTLLLRVYGPSTDSLLSRTRELQTLHTISSRYSIGPRIYGTFDNGRIEEYFNSTPLTASDIRDSQISSWIAARMAELHSVDIRVIDDIGLLNARALDGLDPRARRLEMARTVGSWIAPAESVLGLRGVPESVRGELDLPGFKREWGRYLDWVLGRPKTFGMRRVFAHNDAQYGNLLRLKDNLVGVDKHRQIVVVDFEYAAANPAAYDVANHFHEWTTNYHCASPHQFTPSKYPSALERRNFYAAYIKHSAAGDTLLNVDVMMEELDRDVEALTPASHAAGALWGIIQAREDVVGGVDRPEFDYISYARGRMAAFRRDLNKFGILATV